MAHGALSAGVPKVSGAVGVRTIAHDPLRATSSSSSSSGDQVAVAVVVQKNARRAEIGNAFPLAVANARLELTNRLRNSLLSAHVVRLFDRSWEEERFGAGGGTDSTRYDGTLRGDMG